MHERGFYTYILRTESGACTYVGYTVNIARRLRQHRGEICGGARYTRNMRARGEAWHLWIVVGGFESSRSALQCEYWQKRRAAGKSARSLTNEQTRIISDAGPRRLQNLLRVLHTRQWNGGLTLWYSPEHTPQSFLRGLPFSVSATPIIER